MTGNQSIPSGGIGPGATPSVSSRMSIGGRLRYYFLTGVIVSAPIGITMYIVWAFIDLVDRNVAPLLPVALQPGGVMLLSIPGLGVIVALVAVTLVGFLTANFLGRRLVRLGERIVARMPIVRSVYSALKQIFETMLTQSSSSFRQVVLIEFPRKGVWAAAFVANERTGEAGRRLGQELVAVYLPTALNPTSGYLLFLPKQDVVTLDMSVEEGMKLILSGGMVIPPDRSGAEELSNIKSIPATGS